MLMSSQKPVGKTKSQGWQVGVQRLFPLNNWEAWEMMLKALHLDDPTFPDFAKKVAFETDTKTQVEIRSIEEGALLRMKWQPEGWENNSTLQLRFIPSQKGTRISIHHEWLVDAEQREAMRVQWTELLAKLHAVVSA